MPDKQPIRWKVVMIVNLGMLGGCILATFIVPPTTRLSVFGFSCLFCVVALNIRFYFKGYRRQQPKQPTDPAGAKEPKDVRFWRMVVMVAVWAIILWQVAHRYWLK